MFQIYLLQYFAGSVKEHDHEIEEARWVGIGKALEMLTFKSERSVVEKARELIWAGKNNANGIRFLLNFETLPFCRHPPVASGQTANTCN